MKRVDITIRERNEISLWNSMKRVDITIRERYEIFLWFLLFNDKKKFWPTQIKLKQL